MTVTEAKKVIENTEVVVTKGNFEEFKEAITVLKNAAREEATDKPFIKKR